MKIALYSGSFNPVHNGHLAIAEAALADGFDEVWLVVSPQNPHKNETDLWPFEERMKLVELALHQRSRMKASDCEQMLPRPSYTIDTLDFLKKSYPQHQFSLLIGEDNLQKFHLWKEYRRILDEFGLVIYPRSGPRIIFESHPQIRRIKAPLLEISSSEIREKLAKGDSVKGLVPTKVEQYLLRKLKEGRHQSLF